MMVRVNALGGDERLLRYAAEVASRFDVHVIGVSAYPALPQSLHILQAAAGGTISDEQEQEYRASAQEHIDEAEARFRAALAGYARSLAWRSSIVEKTAALGLIQQLRAADLIVTNPVGQGGAPGTPKLINVGDLVMNAGRPVLLVPHAVESLDLGTAVVAWKDTRETRRAVRDALPLLSRYQIVTVLEVAPAAEIVAARQRVADVVDWLGHHGIIAGSRVETSSGADTNRLAALVRDMGAGLLVAGAYGHARLREWTLGGVTEDLLLYPKVPTIMSH
jgi:nucleotide-binding universal stress UspA family protein